MSRLAIAAALALLPAASSACPVCARDASPHLALFVGAMLLVPFALATGVLWVVRRGEHEEES